MKKISIIITLIIIAGVIYLFSNQDKSFDLQTNEAVGAIEGFEYLAQDISYEEIPTNFVHRYDPQYASFLGGTVLDLDNDGVDEIYVTGGKGQNDVYLKYVDGSLVNEISSLGVNNLEAGYGVESIDIDNDGDVDLIITRQDGVYVYYNTNNVFEEVKLNVSFEDGGVPVDVVSGDIDMDGDADLYVSTFISADRFAPATFNDTNHAQNNVMLRNDGNRVFTDITEESGLSYMQNTFTASFVELNGDEYLDLVVSPNTGKARIYENIGGKFDLAYESEEYGFWMGIGLDDIDMDGDVDIFFSNIGSTIPTSVARGDLRDDQVLIDDYLLLRNDGDFEFSNDISKVKSNLPFGWGIVASDLNGDNMSEYIVMQNYIKWPPHKLKKDTGSILSYIGDVLVNVIGGTGLENKNFGFSALLGDFNGDGVKDVSYLNVDGPLRVLLAEHEEVNNIVKVLLPDDANSAGMSLELSFAGITVEKKYLPKQGIMTDQAPYVKFSLGNQDKGVLTVTDRFGKSSKTNVVPGVIDLR